MEAILKKANLLAFDDNWQREIRSEESLILFIDPRKLTVTLFIAPREQSLRLPINHVNSP
ncbi:hypothetical protein CHS0354_011404 [Potamilus streckersoni]|uniref:Uncharacterized protein n=1 Tax=Potamilus streckersoni TaxID=2493646 RepID=A0AAE0TG46_9BIVA|nr:hypothetical protein CHS0354_011404 [Potamilus streckersoni]